MTGRGAEVLRLPARRSPAETVELAAGHRLIVERGAEATPDRIRLTGSDGETRLTIRVGAEGATVEIRGDAAGLQVAGRLAIEADSLALRGRDEVVIESGGSIRVEAKDDLVSEARAQAHEARLGNVDIRANDDVTLDGERIKMNC